ncbi:MAG TPA: mechanosensitive ion channel domain-containing protein [Thermohalobaculum sp.]|nr:mechanosensitive ion channel domain-containing protein [Thermohalobaculum sp.]
MDWAAYAMNILVAIVILVAGFWIAGRAGRIIRHIGMRYPQLDVTLFSFLGSLARWTIVALTIIVVLGQFGVETTSLIALIGAAGLAVGLALQGTLSNLAAGVMLLIFRPFKVGDYVTAGGHSGTVEEISLFTSSLVSPDNVLTIVPNGDIWASAVTNFSAKDTRRLDLVFGVSYGSDLKAAEAALRNVIAADDRIRSTPAEPFVAVTNLGDSSVDFTIRVWCAAADYWALRFDMLRRVKETFDERGIEIPFPTTTIIRQSAE